MSPASESISVVRTVRASVFCVFTVEKRRNYLFCSHRTDDYRALAFILHRIPHSGFVQVDIGSDGTDGTASRLSLVEGTGMPPKTTVGEFISGYSTGQ